MITMVTGDKMMKLEATLTFHKCKCFEQEHVTLSTGSSPGEMMQAPQSPEIPRARLQLPTN